MYTGAHNQEHKDRKDNPYWHGQYCGDTDIYEDDYSEDSMGPKTSDTK